MNKSVLITGMNNNQCVENFYLRQQLKVIPSQYSLVRCLRDMGYKVTQKSVELEEKINHYDYVVVYLAGPRQLVATQFYNGLWAISQALDSQLILAFDDWQTHDILKSINEDNLFAKFVLDVNKKSLEDVEFLKPYFLRAIEKIRSKQYSVLLSAFAGGDLTKLIDYPADKLFSFNPNPYHHNRKPNDRDDVPKTQLGPFEAMEYDETIQPVEKLNMFNFASLVQSKTKRWLKKQQITWPIEFFGSKAEGQRRLTEKEMVKVYAEQWGCLMPGYDHSGSGWWRARPLQVADAGSILIGDKDELSIYYGDSEVASVKALDIERMSWAQREEFAKIQRELLTKNHPLNKQSQKSELRRIFK